MLKTIFSLCLMIFFVGHVFSAGVTPHTNIDSKLDVLKKQVISDILASSVNEKETIHFSETMKADGSWADIDYTDKTRGGWKVNDHLVRLNDMAVMYKRPGSKWTGDAKLQEKIITGLNFWFKNDFICPNWWYPQIGVPKVLGPTMLLVEDKLVPAQKDAGVKNTGTRKNWNDGAKQSMALRQCHLQKFINRRRGCGGSCRESNTG